jgi:hypothetical protein
MKIIKDKLSKGRCYPMKSSILETEIDRAGVKSVVTLFHHNSAFWDQRPLVQATFFPPGQMVDNEEELVWIGCRAVPAEVCHLAKACVEQEIIPDLIAWVTGIEALPTDSPVRREKQEFERDWSPPTVQ